MFIDSGKVTPIWGKQPSVMIAREEFNKDAAREDWEKLIAQGWRRIEEVCTKQRDRAAANL